MNKSFTCSSAGFCSRVVPYRLSSKPPFDEVDEFVVDRHDLNIGNLVSDEQVLQLLALLVSSAFVSISMTVPFNLYALPLSWPYYIHCETSLHRLIHGC
eukprot:2078780-Amphidinium_carterae.1